MLTDVEMEVLKMEILIALLEKPKYDWESVGDTKERGDIDG